MLIVYFFALVVRHLAHLRSLAFAPLTLIIPFDEQAPNTVDWCQEGNVQPTPTVHTVATGLLR